MEMMDLVQNSSELVAAMGYWPSFHDANVLGVVREDSTFTIRVHLFAMTNQVDSAGFYVLEKHHVVTVAMSGVISNSLPAGYESDCLDRLSFSGTDNLLTVTIESHMGYDGAIQCESAKIMSVVPCSGTTMIGT